MVSADGFPRVRRCLYLFCWHCIRKAIFFTLSLQLVFGFIGWNEFITAFFPRKHNYEMSTRRCVPIDAGKETEPFLLKKKDLKLLHSYKFHIALNKVQEEKPLITEYINSWYGWNCVRKGLSEWPHLSVYLAESINNGKRNSRTDSNVRCE